MFVEVEHLDIPGASHFVTQDEPKACKGFEQIVCVAIVVGHDFCLDLLRPVVYPVASKFQQAIKQRIVQETKDTINAIAEKHVLPNVAQYIEELTIQKTNEYGEKLGDP